METGWHIPGIFRQDQRLSVMNCQIIAFIQSRSTHITVCAFLVVLVFLSEPLYAQDCNKDNPSDCLDGVGPAVFNPDNIRVTSTQITKRLDQSTSEKEKETAFLDTASGLGLAAGDTFQGWGGWGSFNLTNFNADIPINSTVQPVASYDAHLKSFLAGIDHLFMERLVLGAAAGYEDSSVKTFYNGGSNDVSGFTIAPYLAYLINDVFNFDVSAGYSSLDYETDRIDNISGGTIFGQFDSDRWFVTSNITATLNREQWYVKGRIGYLYTAENQDGYTETGPNTARTIGDRHIDLSQVSVAGEIAYNFQNIEPYVNLAYVNDISRDNGTSAGGLPGSVGSTQPDDKDEFQFYAGLRYFNKNLSGVLEYGRIISRDTLDSQNIMLTVRYDL